MYLLQNVKLASVKTDSKFSTTTQIVKLVGSYLISKIVVRINDVKRTKMVGHICGILLASIGGNANQKVCKLL